MPRQKRPLASADTLIIRPSRPKGGQLIHARPDGKWGALCGYAPSSPKAHSMRGRAGWWNAPDSPVDCPKCLKAIEKLVAEGQEVVTVK